jgi:hypothetical protein
MQAFAIPTLKTASDNLVIGNHPRAKRLDFLSSRRVFRTPPIERGQQACPTCIEEEQPCEPKPADKGSYIGNDPRFSVCIKADPANTDATCEPYAQQLRDRATQRALQLCLEDHEVVCEKRTCEKACRNTSVIRRAEARSC